MFATYLTTICLLQPLPVPIIPNPQYLCELVLADKTAAVSALIKTGADRSQAEYEVSNWYYLSWHASPQEALSRFKKVQRWWVGGNTHLAIAEITFTEVPGSNGLLWRFDRREPDWHPDAISKAFNEDTTFRQPAVSEKVAGLLRTSVNRKVNDKTLHVEALTWAPRLFRDTIESARAKGVYYDLLFSIQRFGRFKTDHGYTQSPDQRHQGWYTNNGGKTWVYKDKLPSLSPQETPTAKSDPNFPASLEDWEGFFRRQSKANGTVLGRNAINARIAVVPGYQEDADNGSPVSRFGRAAQIEQGDHGPVMETYDAQEPTGDTDLLEFAANFALGKEPKKVFGETLAALPSGGQAGALWNDQRKRVEQAAGDIAKGPQPLLRKGNIPVCKYLYHPNVRNPGDCVRCHGLSYGIIEPRDSVKDLWDKLVDTKFLDPADALQFRGLFQGTRDLIPGYQARYKTLLERTTSTWAIKPDGQRVMVDKPWTARQLVEAFEEYWNWYDSPVTKEQAALELGIPVASLDRLNRKTLTARPKALLEGIACPRPTWDTDVKPALVKVLVSEYPQYNGGQPE